VILPRCFPAIAVLFPRCLLPAGPVPRPIAGRIDNGVGAESTSSQGGWTDTMARPEQAANRIEIGVKRADNKSANRVIPRAEPPRCSPILSTGHHARGGTAARFYPKLLDATLPILSLFCLICQSVHVKYFSPIF
jgi:hypothetical protein